MSRVHRFIHNAWSGSALIILSALYGLASLPLAVHFLTKKEIGLWLTSAAIADYLTMIDLGTTASMSRLLVDHKDQRTPEGYGSMLRTGMVVLGVQGVIILVVGAGLSFFTGTLLKVQASLATEAAWLMFGLAVMTAASFGTRVFGQVLTAHQRSDITSYGQMVALGLGFAALWGAFACGFGIFSLLAARVVNWVFQSTYGYVACRRYGFWPQAHEWGPVSREKFRALFKYGLDIFLIGLGTQLINSSQVIVVNRAMGLEAAAVWGAMIKAWTLVQQLLWRAVAVAMPGFAEMQVQGELRRMWERYRVFFSTITALCGLFAVLAAIGNGPFVAVWMHGEFSWSQANDWLYGAFLIVATQAGAHNYIIMFLKDIRRQKYVYFAEGITFISLGLLLVPWGGFPVMLGCSVLCCALCTGGYGAFRVAEMQGIPMREIFTSWQKPLVIMLAAIIPPAVLLVYLTRDLPPTLPFLLRCGIAPDTAHSVDAVLSPLLQLVLRCGPVGLIGVYVLFKKCLSAELVNRIQGFMPKRLRAYC